MKEKGMDLVDHEEINPVCLGRRFYRLVDNPLEKAFAMVWSKECSTGLANYMLSSTSNEREPISLMEQSVANTVIQWLGTPVGQAFLLEVFKRPEAEHFLEYLLGDPAIRAKVHKILK